MKAWKWRCTTHDLDLLTLQTGDREPLTCSPLAELVWPHLGLCWFVGKPVLDVYALSHLGSAALPSHSLPQVGNIPSATPVAGGAAGEAGRVATPPLPATRPTT